MLRTTNRLGIAAAAAVVVLAAGTAGAQQIITQWNFNSPVADGNTGTCTTSPAIGAGTASVFGGVTQTCASGDASGGSSDPAFGDDSAWQTTNYAAQGVGSGTTGVEFAVSTVGFSGITVSFDTRHSNTSSRYVQLFYSTDGTNFIAGPLFNATAGDTWYNARTVALTGVPAADNNPNFKFRVAAVFDPGLGSQYSASQGTSTYAPGGTLRYDMVTVSGTSFAPTPPTGTGVAAPSALCAGATSVTLSVATSPGQSPTSTGVGVVANLSSIGGSSAQAFHDDGLDGDTQSGDGIFTYVATLPGNLTPGQKTMPFTVSDEQSRTSGGSISLAVADCSQASPASLVISAVFGGGGNTGAPLNADFVEIHNRTTSPVDLNGWAIQYAPSFSQSFDGTRQVNLGGTIPAGGFYLVQMTRGSDTNGLPFTADLNAFPADPGEPPNNGIAMANDAGRLALTNTTTPILLNCAASNVVDFVGYGSSSLCYEGVAPTGNLSNTLYAARKTDGCQDTNQNFNDFDIVFPGFPRNSATTPVTCGLAATFAVNVSKTGAGAGTVTSAPAGINCGATCSANFAAGTPLSLTATPNSVSRFAGWTGGCSGSGPCGFTVNSATNVTARFVCRADIDGNGAIEPADIAGFVNMWLTSLQTPGDLGGDFDHNSLVEPSDIAAFVNAWLGSLTTGQCQ